MGSTLSPPLFTGCEEFTGPLEAAATDRTAGSGSLSGATGVGSAAPGDGALDAPVRDSEIGGAGGETGTSGAGSVVTGTGAGSMGPRSLSTPAAEAACAPPLRLTAPPLRLTAPLDASRSGDRGLTLGAAELPCPRVGLADAAEAGPASGAAVPPERPESVSAHAVEHPETMAVPIPSATARPPIRPTNCAEVACIRT